MWPFECVVKEDPALMISATDMRQDVWPIKMGTLTATTTTTVFIFPQTWFCLFCLSLLAVLSGVLTPIGGDMSWSRNTSNASQHNEPNRIVMRWILLPSIKRNSETLFSASQYWPKKLLLSLTNEPASRQFSLAELNRNVFHCTRKFSFVFANQGDYFARHCVPNTWAICVTAHQHSPPAKGWNLDQIFRSGFASLGFSRQIVKNCPKRKFCPMMFSVRQTCLAFNSARSFQWQMGRWKRSWRNFKLFACLLWIGF